MKKKRFLKIKEFAELCGVAPAAIYKVRKTKLDGCFLKKKKKLWINTHAPLAVEYYNQKIVEFKTKTGNKPYTGANATKHERIPTEEKKEVEIIDPGINHVQETTRKIKDYSAHVKTETQELQNLTLKQITMYHKSIQGFNAYVKGLTGIADYQNKSILAKQRRGELIERAGLGSALVGLVDQAFSRLVGEIPVSIAPELIAIAQTNSDTVQKDIVKLIQKHVSKVLKDCKYQITQKLERVKSEV